MAKVALYARVSGHSQAKEETIETQRHYLEEWAARSGHEVIGWYADEAVRSIVPIPERPEGGRLIRDAKKGKFDIVAIYHIRRWSRYMQVWYDGKRLLDESGVELLCLNDDLRDETPGDRFSLGVKLLVGEYDRDLIEQNCLDGKYRRAHEGGYAGGVVPYGYRVTGARKQRRLEPDPAEADIVRRIYLWLVEDALSCVQIARRLNAMRVPTACQAQEEGRHRSHCKDVRGLWTNSRVSRIVRNPTYCGERQFGASNKGRRGTVTQRVEALIDPSTWDRAQKRLEENTLMARRNAKHEYLLRGLVICAHCGRRCYGKTMNKGNPVAYYVCNRKTLKHQGYEPDLPPCPLPHVRADALEQDLWAKLRPLILDVEGTIQKLQDRLAGGGDRMSGLQETMDALRLAVERKRAARRRAVDLATDGLITREELAEQVSRLQKEGEELEAQIEEVARQMSATQHREEMAHRAQELLARWESRVSEDATPEEKRRAIEHFVIRIELTRIGDAIQPVYDFVLDEEARSIAPYVTAYGVKLLALRVPGARLGRAA
jgi:site-specific DNA recombinase